MKKLLTLAALTLMLVLAACGGSEPEAPSAVAFDYAMTTEFVFDPANITVQTGTPVSINLDNTASTLSHSWVLVKKGAVPDDATLEEIESQAIARANSGEVAAGDTFSINFPAPEPGAYEFVCSVAGHLAGGMKGNFVVTE